MSRRAIILAGGRGQRLRPYTIVLPKPLIPIGEYPILEIVVRQLAHYGFDHITMALNHQANIIQSFFGNGEAWNIKIDYSIEDKPLNTMGPLQLLKDLPDNFLVMNGDILCDMDYSAFFDFHEQTGNIFSISSYERQAMIDYGTLESTSDTRLLTGFREKPKYCFEVSMGIYMASRKVLDHIPKGVPFGFDHLMLKLLDLKQKVNVRKHFGIWLDIGRPDDCEAAIEIFETHKAKFLFDA